MSKDFSKIPHTRSWKDIPQPVKPRAMSGGGRWRLALAGLRIAGFVTAVAVVGWGAWQVAQVLEGDSKTMPAAAKAVVVKDIFLVTDGVLDREWIERTLALPPKVSLMELDLRDLERRVLASGQVRTATLKLNFPDTLAVTISERSPVARLFAEFGDDARKELLVARDGWVFEGVDFDPAMIGTLPWIEVATLKRRAGKIDPINGMEAVAELLAKAKLEAEHLYRDWKVVSLARLAADGEIEVRSHDGVKVIFGTREDYFRQLARLDLLLDTVAKAQPGKRLGEINLAVGALVPVAFALDAAPSNLPGAARAKPAAPPAFPAISTSLPNPSIRIKPREF